MTEPESPFEDVPVSLVTRSTDARWLKGWAVVIVTILAVLIAKPWGVPAARETSVPTPAVAALPSPSSTPLPTPLPTSRPDGARQYDPGLFGRFSVAPGWALWPTLYVYRFGLSGPMSIDAAAGPGPSAPAPSATPTEVPRATPAPTPPPGAGQLVDIGSADLLMVIGVDTPADVRITEARLTRFPAGSGEPVPVTLIELPPPWPVSYFHVYGLRVADDAEPDFVAAWPAGVYRLDLTVAPGDEVRRIGLLVRPALGSVPSPGAAGGTASSPTPSAVP